MIALVGYAFVGLVVAGAVNAHATRRYDRPLEPVESLMVWLIWPAAVIIVAGNAVEQIARSILDMPEHHR